MSNNVSKTGKVVVVGAGFVGSSYAFSLVNQGVVNELVLIDLNREKAEGEARDLNHGIPFGSPMKIRAGGYEECRDAELVVITAGANQSSGETRLDLLKRNATIFKSVVASIMESTFDGILLVATNPVDVLTQITWQVSGLPKERVIGSGTILDTARFRYMLSDYFEVDSRNIHAYIVGEHGDSELATWSHVQIGGVKITDFLKTSNVADHPDMQRIFKDVRDAAYHIIERKGATYYGIAMGLVRITKAIFGNENSILTVSTLLEGEYDQENVFIGVPAIINRQGVKKVMELQLNSTEQEQFAYSANILRRNFQKLDI